MKKPFLVALSLLFANAGAYVGLLLFAQRSNPAMENPPKEPASLYRVAHVDVRAFFEKCERAIAYRRELDKDLTPYRERATKLTREIKELERQYSSSGDLRESIENSIKKRRRDLEDLSFEVSRLFRKREDEILAAIHSELDKSIEAAVKSYGFNEVVKFGTPARVVHIPLARKTPYIDLGTEMPPELPNHVNITDIVVGIANGKEAAK